MKRLQIKTDEEIEIMRESCELVSKVHELMAKELKIGRTGIELDKLAEEFILDHNAKPSFKGYGGFPYTLCISPNYTVVHGFPSNRPFEATDMVSIDCGVYYKGFHGDCAYSYAFSRVAPETLKLLEVTKKSLQIGIAMVKEGVRTGDLGYEIQMHCEKNGYSVVRELVGHGVGRSLHEAPDVPNYGKRGKGEILKKNTVIAIEPMINMGSKEVYTTQDKWTVNTNDHKMSAHFEHTVWVRLDDAVALTRHDWCEDAIKSNKELILV